MEWHWYYLLAVAFIVVHVWAFIAQNETIDEEIEQMWRDNF